MKALDRVSRVLAHFAAAALFATLIVTVGNIGLRQVATAYFGTVEIVTLLAVVLNGLALAEAQVTRSHIAVDLLMTKAAVRTQLLVGAVVTVVSIALFTLLAQQLVVYGLNLRDSGAATEALRLPYWPFSLVLAVGVAGLALALLNDLLAVGRNLRSDTPASIW